MDARKGVITMKGLAGTWYGRHGARLELTVQHDGTIEGTFFTPGDGSSGAFPLVGMCDTRSFEGSRSFGFVVVWNNDYVNQHSATSWSGQYQIVNGEEMLTTNWLLTRETAPEECWAATMVGSDTFRREWVGAAEDAAQTEPQAEPAG